jgi:uncharacterized protein (TIGR03382 family)
MRSGWTVVVLAVGSVLAISTSASAWQIEDPLHHNCHERLTADALAQVGYLPYAPPSTQLVHEDVQFLDDGDFAWTYDRNMQMAALITGVRYNDLDGSGDFHFNTLAPVHNNPVDQGAHCLRAHADQGSAGDVSALANCRAFITDQFHQAVATADANGHFNVGQTESVQVHVQSRGTIGYPLSTFFFHVGRGMHALQDSFTHTFRDPTWHQPGTFFNWVDQVRGDLVESVNGHGHEKELDDCTSARPSRPDQRAAAERASVEFLAVLWADVTPDVREQLFTQFLDRWLTLQPGCTLSDSYCDNAVYAELLDRWSQDYPTRHSAESGCNSTSGVSLLAILGVALLMRRRKARAWLAALVLVLMLTVFLLPASAWADEAVPSTPSAGATPAPTPTPTPTPTPEVNHDPSGLRYLLHVAGSFDNPGFAYGGGAMWQFSAFELGIEAEHNPWFSLDRTKLNLGSLNVYARGGWRRQLSANYSYRAGVDLGIATLLADVVGTSPGSTAFFLGVEPLSVIYHPGGHIEYELTAFSLQVPEVQLRGWPFGYPQYRVTFAMRFR